MKVSRQTRDCKDEVRDERVSDVPKRYDVTRWSSLAHSRLTHFTASLILSSYRTDRYLLYHGAHRKHHSPLLVDPARRRLYRLPLTPYFYGHSKSPQQLVASFRTDMVSDHPKPSVGYSTSH